MRAKGRLQATPGELLLSENELQTQPAVAGTLPWAALGDKYKNSRHGLWDITPAQGKSEGRDEGVTFSDSHCWADVLNVLQPWEQ